MLHRIQYETEPYGTNQYSITLTEGKFAGVKYVLGKTELIEGEDNLTLKYHYDIIESKVEDSDVKEFETLIGDVLMQMLSDGVKNNDLVYSGGVDAD
ncbi:hypothetical protein EB001_16750 [bacterium]|nr:hypothetical protein [bacterium]